MTQILTNNHKSGINQNNIKVATVTEEQQSTFAVKPGLLPIITPTAPIVATTQVYQVSRTNGAITYPTYVNCDSNNRIFCKVTVTAGARFKSIAKALLKIRKHSGSEAGCAVYTASENMMELLANPTNYVSVVTENGTDYAVVDVSDHVKTGETQVFYIAIQSNQGNVLTLYNTASLEVAYVEDDDLIPSGSIENPIGAKGGYSINARNGKLRYNQQIYASQGGLMPFALSLCYNASHCNTSTSNDVDVGIKGWVFNYQQSLKESGSDMLYLDASNALHTFKHPTNNTSVWYDATGKNGMVLVATSNGYTMTDGKTTTLNFDTSKRLVSIAQNLSNSKTVSTAIEYASNGKISKVTDGLGDVYNFAWTDTLVQIQKGTTLVAEITLASQRVAQVKYSLSGETVDFAYDTNGQLVSAFSNASQQKALFQYNSVGAISSVKNYVSKTSDVATDSHHFQYLLLQTRIASCRNSDVASNAYCTMAHMFAEDGELLSTAEVKQGVFKPLRYRTKLDFEKSAGALSDYLTKAWFGYDETIETFVTQTTNQIYLDATNQTRDTYAFSAVAQIEYANAVEHDELHQIYFEVFEGDQVLAKKQLDLNSREQQVIVGDFTLTPHNHILYARLVLQNVDAKVNFGYIKLYATKNSAQKQCVNVDTTLAQITENDGVSLTPWFEQDYCQLQYGTNAVNDVVFTSKDYELTLISRLQNPTAYNVWYNDGKNMLYQVDGVSLVYGDTIHSLDAIKVCTVSTTAGKTLFHYVEPHSTYMCKIRSVTSSNEQGVFYEEFVNSNFQTAKVVDEHGISTVYTYDANGSVTKVVTTAPTGGLLNIEETSTYHDNNLLKTSRSKRYLTEYVHSYVYGTDYELTQETQPNGQQYNYTYSPEKEKLTGISTQLEGESLPCQNGIEYQNALVKNLTDTNNTYYFVYDNRNNIAEFRMNGQILLRKSIYYATDGTTSTTTYWANGATFVKTYDKYNRLIKVMLGENSSPSTIVAYIYSDNEVDDTVTDPQHSSLAISATSKLRKVVDYTTNPTTVQTYVYNNLGELESVQSGALTQTVEQKDFANRPTRVSRKFNNVQCMVNTYTYRDIVSNALQSEKVEYYLNSSVQTDYTYDGLGRTQQTALHSNISNAGVTTKYTYVPRQEKQQSPIGDSGVGITPTQPFVTVTVGTTPLVGNVKRYLTVGSTETLLATEDVEYDSCGNITKYGDTTFVYDKLNRLVRENNKTIDKTIVWEYDVSGNVTSRREYAYTEGAVGTQTGSCSFGYNHATHKDWLTSFVGIPITYDAMGNPTSYKGTTFGWSRGRLLTSATQGSTSISMGYNVDGVRCNKTVITGSGVVSTTYHYEGANLMHEVVTKNGTTTNRKYLYNSQGIVGFIQDDVEYIYHKNIFGDIVAIYQGATKVAEYAYDAYGRNFINVDIDGIATSNPFRYRGYFWDSDLSLYYLMSRYYDPATSRFINADSLEYLDPESIGGLNLYAYCQNNPVMGVDPEGTSALLIRIVLGASISAIGNIFAQIVLQGKDFKDIDWLDVVASALSGAVSSAIPIKGLGSLILNSAVTAVTENSFKAITTGEKLDIKQTLVDFGVNMLVGAISLGVSKGVEKLSNKVYRERVGGYSKLQQKLRAKGHDYDPEVVRKLLNKYTNAFIKVEHGINRTVDLILEAVATILV